MVPSTASPSLGTKYAEPGRDGFVRNCRDATFFVWLLLLIVCWPLALAALVLYPIVWLVLLPFRLVGITLEGVFRLLGVIIRLPARILRGPRRKGVA